MSVFKEHLQFLYGAETAERVLPSLLALLEDYRAKVSLDPYVLSEKDTILITYGDQFQSACDSASLNVLHEFYLKHLKKTINSIHFLPFFPYTSDDGFSVVDYHQIDPDLGDWSHVQGLAQDARLMFDAVVNHCSKSSPWFQAYLEGKEGYENHFVALAPDTDTSKVTRPRALPLLHPFKAHDGERHIWTTFSEDQVDLNAAEPKVILDIIEVLLFYVEKGARLIRLDAIAFLWKELGTTCLHHPKTHRIVQLFRSVFEEICPEVTIITETNVPHVENLSYFGDGTNEAHMVYNFTLPPLLAWSLLKGKASELTKWAKTLQLPSAKTTFFNFTASHDGIGMRPLQGILSNSEIDFLGQTALDHGGQVSYKNNGDGTKSPYELNCNYMDFLTAPSEGLRVKIRRFICSQAVMLAMPGVPGIYVHSLLGSGNDIEGMNKTGRARTINREKFVVSALESQMEDPESRRSLVFSAYQKLLAVRQQESAFHPQASASYPIFHDDVFAIERGEGSETILCLFNFADQVRHVTLGGKRLDLISGEKVGVPLISMEPWQVVWLKAC